MKATVADLGNGGRDRGRARRGSVALFQQNDHGKDPGLLVAQELAELFGDVITPAREGAPEFQVVAMDDELAGGASGTD